MWRFFKDFFIYGVASVLGKIAAIFLMPIYTNVLTKEEYGVMALITSIGGVVDILSNLNIHSGIARDYYEEGINRKKLVSTGFFSILSISFIVLLLVFLSRRFWSIRVLGLSSDYLNAFTVFLFTVPLSSLQSYFSILTRYKKKPILYSVGTVIKLVIQISISIYGVVILRSGIISVFWGFLAADLFGTIFFSYINKENITLSFDRDILKRALLFSLPTIPAVLAGWIDGSLGQVLIGKHVSLSELGVYSIALSFASVFSLISVAFQNVWNPYLFDNYKNEGFGSSIRKLFAIISLFLIVLSILLSLFSRELVLLLSNEGYLSACRYITLLCIPMSFYLLFPFASSGVSISRDTKYIGYSYVIGSVANIIFMYMTISSLGVIAVPISLALSRIIAYFLMYKASEKKIEYGLPNFLLVILVFCICVCYVVVILELSLLIRIAITFALGGFLYFYLEKKFKLNGALKMIMTKMLSARR